jgi:hypothetical protein
LINLDTTYETFCLPYNTLELLLASYLAYQAAAMSSNKIQQWFPWTEAPVIVNAPMAGAASPELAAEVTKAGGLGMCV